MSRNKSLRAKPSVQVPISKPNRFDARFWKCALQVNPEAYGRTYRGKDHGLKGQMYLEALAQACKENDIALIGLADHGSVADVDATREHLHKHGVVVLPGFEICTTEKIHWVCLFPEATTTVQLDRYLGTLKVLDPADGARPSELGGAELLEIVDRLGGFCYAAHVAGDKGLLTQKANHLWVNPRLTAAQIAGAPEDLQQEYRSIAVNKNRDYKRDRPIALINARDVSVPKELADPRSSCFIKMTSPSFHSLTVAFKDAGSRIRRSDEVVLTSASHIARVRIHGGYLDGLDVALSPHLNAVIGGRGAGKSTLLECIRFCLALEPKGAEAKRVGKAIVEENLGTTGSRIELEVVSASQRGQRFIISRSASADPVVFDERGKKSALTIEDILPGVEVYGQNEVIEIARDRDALVRVLDRYLPSREEYERHVKELARKLSKNAKILTDGWEEAREVEGRLARLPALEEQLQQLNTLGIGAKLRLSPLLEKEKQIPAQVRAAISEIESLLEEIAEQLPDASFLDEYEEEHVHHSTLVATIRAAFIKALTDIHKKLVLVSRSATGHSAKLEPLLVHLEDTRAKAMTALEREFAALPAVAGKTGREVGRSYTKLQAEAAEIRPHQHRLAKLKKSAAEARAVRQELLGELRSLRATRSAALEKAVRALNRTLKGKLRLGVVRGGNRKELRDFLGRIRGIGEKGLEWIEGAEELSIEQFVVACRAGPAALTTAGWGLTQARAEAICGLGEGDLIALETVYLDDQVTLELNVAHAGERYKELRRLSTGQQCTAILHLILLDNHDPLIMDQPEDNLDNAFIAERIVQEVRTAKTQRQFVFATHNANIPVFGDAEWIGVFDASDGRASIPEENQGSIDTPLIREYAARILDGGKEAFLQRQRQYGY